MQIGIIDARRLRQAVERDLVILQPLGVGLAAPEALLHFFIWNDAALGGIHQQHFSRLQASFELYFLRRDRQHASFRRHDQQAAVGFEITRRPQTIAVQRGADYAAVRERYSSRTIPGLHQGSVIFVERLFVRMHGAVAIPGFGNQHGHHMWKAAAGERERFDSVIERG